jgi:hypothetical protein
MKFRGRPSYASKARRNNELKDQSNQHLLGWIRIQLENLSPGEHFIIPSNYTHQIIEQSLRSKISTLNRRMNTNIKLHKHTTGEWYIWHCPNPHIRIDKHGNLIDTSIPKPIRSPKPPRKQSPNSTYAPLPDILAYLNMNESTYNSYPFDKQMKLRIQAGIALRDERNKRNKLSKQFTMDTSIDTSSIDS